MEWFTLVIVPLMVALVPSILAYLGLRAQIRADIRKDKSEREVADQAKQDALLKAIKDRNEQEDESLRCLLRTQILNTYFKHIEKENRTLNQWESENLHQLYSAYTGLGGNSFIKDLYARMNQWDVIKN